MRRPYGTVTQEMKFGSVHISFSVSVTDPAFHNLDKVELRVGRWFDDHQSFPATVTVVKKLFDNKDQAWDWAFEHGYLQPYYKRVWCRKHRELHVSGTYVVPAREELKSVYKSRPSFVQIQYTPTCFRKIVGVVEVPTPSN